MPGTPYAPASLAPSVDDSNRTLALKIAAQLAANATGDVTAYTPTMDDDETDALRKICGLLYAANAGDITINF